MCISAHTWLIWLQLRQIIRMQMTGEENAVMNGLSSQLIENPNDNIIY